MSYVPDMTGRYTILIKYGGDEIPYSPYRIRAVPAGDASKCTVTGERPPPPPLNAGQGRGGTHSGGGHTHSTQPPTARFQPSHRGAAEGKKGGAGTRRGG